jgi:hypothetical protein
MNRVFLILLLLFSGVTFASENLKREDYNGAWKSTYTAVKNEKQILEISLDALSVFERHFEGSDSQWLYIGTLDKPGSVMPRNHIFTGEKISWVKLEDGLPQYPEMDPE